MDATGVVTWSLAVGANRDGLGGHRRYGATSREGVVIGNSENRSELP
jgi:hypothetical protein